MHLTMNTSGIRVSERMSAQLTVKLKASSQSIRYCIGSGGFIVNHIEAGYLIQKLGKHIGF